MHSDEKKRRAARAALELVEPGSVVGVGTGSTTNQFIDALGEIRDRVAGAVPSSQASAERLERQGIRLVDLNAAAELALYVDGADEATRRCELLKGGGGALTREKIIAAAAHQFVCIVDDGKLVERLGAFPLPVEVIPLARGHVTKQISLLGGRAVWRVGCTTDNGNEILDVHGLVIDRPLWLEQELNQIAGVVTNGLFCRRPADLLLVGSAVGVTRIASARE